MQWLKRHLPARETLLGSRWMRWLPARLHHPRLWHWSRRGVALGVAVGMFFGLIIPTAQIPFSAVAAAVVRANLPAAAASTLVSNPITTPPIYYGAYRFGQMLINEEGGAEREAAAVENKGNSLQAQISRIGPPLFLGLACIAVVVSTASYILVNLLWTLGVIIKRRQGRLRGTNT